MPGPPVTHATTVLCPHGAPATAVPTQVSVLGAGAPLATASAVYLVTGCPLAAAQPPIPCITARFQPAPRVLLRGVPAVTALPGTGLAFQGTGAPNGPVIAIGGPFTVNLL